MNEPARAPPAETTRIRFLDGLRGVAILWVLLFHAYVRWPEVVPFGNRFSGVPAVAYGWLGVQLFFLISGFVILMTLERSRTYREFLWHRWLRLFPAMLVCSTLVFITAPLFYERPAGAVQLRDLLPGLTFIDPNWITLATGSPQGLLEGAFWSLFVEMKFYVIAGACFFLFGGNRMIAVLVALFLVLPLALALAAVFPGFNAQPVALFAHLLDTKYFGWFAAGALYYRYFRDPRPTWLGLAVLAALASAASQDGHQRYPQIFALSVVVMFTIAMTSTFARRVLGSRPLQFLGFVSYPLYLFHENMTVSMTVKMSHLVPGLPPALLPLVPMALVCAIAWVVARFAEPWVRGRIRSAFGAPRPCAA